MSTHLSGSQKCKSSFRLECWRTRHVRLTPIGARTHNWLGSLGAGNMVMDENKGSHELSQVITGSSKGGPSYAKGTGNPEAEYWKYRLNTHC